MDDIHHTACIEFFVLHGPCVYNNSNERDFFIDGIPAEQVRKPQSYGDPKKKDDP